MAQEHVFPAPQQQKCYDYAQWLAPAQNVDNDSQHSDPD